MGDVNKHQQLIEATARLHRKHRRTLLGNCKCGWGHGMYAYGDHSDHVGRVIADCLWSVMS